MRRPLVAVQFEFEVQLHAKLKSMACGEPSEVHRERIPLDKLNRTNYCLYRSTLSELAKNWRIVLSCELP